MTYILWTMRYRHLIVEQAEIEIRDRGSLEANHEAAQALGERWCNDKTGETGQFHRLISVRPTCVVTEREPEIVTVAPSISGAKATPIKAQA